MIFYYTIMNYGDRARHVGVGMGVNIARLAVGCPTSVANAHASLDNLGGYFLLKELKRALSLTDGKAFPVKHGNSCRIIAPIFQFLKGIYQNRGGFLVTDITDNY